MAGREEVVGRIAVGPRSAGAGDQFAARQIGAELEVAAGPLAERRSGTRAMSTRSHGDRDRMSAS